MSVAQARSLRHDMTEAEKALWSALRNRRLGGHKFRRQAPIDRYIADFLCEERRLIVEVDGGQHATASQRDDERTGVLNRYGYRVIRFWNNEVMGNMDGVLTLILQALDEK